MFIVFWFLQKISRESLGALLLLSIFVYYFHGYVPFDLLHFQQGMVYTIWFSIGYIFQKTKKSIGLTKEACCFLFFLATVAMVVETRYLSANEVTRIIVRSTWVYHLCIWLLMFIPGIVNILAYQLLLRNCFYIYLFHDPLQYIILRLSFHYGWLASNIGCYAYFFCRTIGVVLISILLGETVRWIKRNFKRINNLQLLPQ